VFALDDPRTDSEHLATLTLPQLHEVYLSAVNAGIARWVATDPPELARFCALSVAEKMRVIRNGAREGLRL
jgi:hypothetical protein